MGDGVMVILMESSMSGGLFVRNVAEGVLYGEIGVLRT